MRRFLLFPSTLLLTLFLLAAPTRAQIKLNTSGDVGIGGNINVTKKLQVICPSCGSTASTAIYAVTNNSGSVSHYGIEGRAEGSAGYHHGVRGFASGGSSVNYGIYGSASGSNNWAGYFSGDVYSTGTYQSSDQRLKKNIRGLQDADMLEKVMQLEPRRYEYLSESELKRRGLPLLYGEEGDHLGLLAQEVEKSFPSMVTEVVHALEYGRSQEEAPRAATTKAVNYQVTIALLSALQEQQAEIEALRGELEALKSGR